MFVYQNKSGAICVTFKSNKPVEVPEYTVIINKDKGTLTINNVELAVAPVDNKESKGTSVEDPSGTTDPETSQGE